MLISTLTFANSNERIEKVSGNDLIATVALNNSTTSAESFSFDPKQISYSELTTEKECTLRGKFTITFSDGTSYSWEGTLTIVGQTCAEFLKELMAN